MAGITSQASKDAQVGGATSLVTSDSAGNLAARTFDELGLASAAKVGGLSGQVDSINGQLGTINGQLGTINGRLGVIDGRLAAVDGRLDALNSRIDDVNREARGGVALALAASGLQFDTRPGKLSVSGGFGNFKGQNALAAGVGYAVSQELRFNAAVSAVQQGDVGVRAGASWTLN
jgi:trimeric autotransporter adhesin